MARDRCLGSRSHVGLCVWAMQKGQEHLSVKWGRSWSACRCTECSSWRHWSFNSQNQGDNCLWSRESECKWTPGSPPSRHPLCSTASTQCNRFSLELRSTIQETATRNMMLHEIPELSPQQSKADNCVWAYGCFRQTLEDQRLGCSSSPGISLGRLLGEYIYFCLLAWFFILFFVVPCAQKQTIYGIRKLWKNRFHLTTQKHLCEIWWTLLDLSENQEIFHGKCAESTQEWRI